MAVSSHVIEKDSVSPPIFFPFEKILAQHLRGFLTELCYTNASVIIAYISSEQQANLKDILASSAELTFKPGVLHYAHRASFEFDWGMPPHVTIDLELRHSEMFTAFTVVFDRSSVGVEIQKISFRDKLGAPDENLSRFARVLADVRITTQ